MSELAVEAISVARQGIDGYRPAALATDDGLRLLAQGVVEFGGIPMERLWLLTPASDSDVDGADVGTLALAALGEPGDPHPLFLVRSGPSRDPYCVELARRVHEAGWAGEDVGITHLDELGGTVVFDLVGWAAPASHGATVLVIDEPVIVVDAPDADRGLSAVGVRVRPGPGPLLITGSGDGTRPPAAEHTFTGSGPCDAWLELCAAISADRVADHERVVLCAVGPNRSGWLAMTALDVAGLRLTHAAEHARSALR